MANWRRTADERRSWSGRREERRPGNQGRPGEEAPPGSRLAHAAEIYRDYLSEKSFAAIEQLRQSAEARRETMASAALRFVLDTPGVDGLIIAPRRIEHFASYGLEPR